MSTYYGTSGDDNNYLPPLYETNSIFGYAGNDTLYGGELADYISGGTGNDTLIGYSGDDSIYGDDGNDTIYAGYGADFVMGGNGDDYAYGWDGNDNLYGADGNDRLYGDEGNDGIYGGTGYDYLEGGAGNDVLNGGGYSSGYSETLKGEAGNDQYVHNWLAGGNSHIVETSGTDTLTMQNISLNDLEAYHVGNNLLLCHYTDSPDGYVDDGVIIENYFATSGGNVEYITIGNNTISLWSLVA